MARFKDQAVCIRLTDWSESSQVVTLLTENHGKVRGLAKGSKRLSPSSIAKFSGGFELLTAGQIVASTKPSSDLATLTEWDLQQPHAHFRRSLTTQQLGLFTADLSNALLADHDAHPQAYHALMVVLEALASPENAAAAILRFQWRLLQDAGYRLELSQDIHTRQPLVPATSYLFDAQLGGFTTQAGQEQAAQPQGPWKVRRSTLEALAAADGSGDLPADVDTLTRANKLLCVYTRFLLDRELPTMRFVLGESS